MPVFGMGEVGSSYLGMRMIRIGKLFAKIAIKAVIGARKVAMLLQAILVCR